MNEIECEMSILFCNLMLSLFVFFPLLMGEEPSEAQACQMTPWTTIQRLSTEKRNFLAAVTLFTFLKTVNACKR
jgi:hypothetical protein